MTISTVAVLTGASAGLGQALALGLMNADTSLITLSRRHDKALAAHAAASGCTVQQIQVDLSNPAAAEIGAEQIVSNLPQSARRYLLINNAGTVDPIAPVARLTSAATITSALSLNVTAVMLLVAAFLRNTPEGSDRRILNISSGAGRNPMPGWGVYCATKAALDRYTQVLAAENPNVKAVSLAPGVVNTGMQKQIRSSSPDAFPSLRRFIDMHEQGQLAEPAAVAAKIIKYLTGADFGATVLDDIRQHA
jgi:sepiapterin reductase